MRPTEICLTTVEYPPRPGGVSVAAARLARYLTTAGYSVHVVTAVERPGAKDDVETSVEAGIQVHRLHQDRPNSAQGHFAYRRLLDRLDDEIGFHLFHGFFLTAAYPCVLAATRGGLRRPVVASIRGSDVATLLDQPPSRAVLLPALRKATWITSVNEAYLERVAEEIDVAGRSSVIRSSVAPLDRSAPAWRPTDANRGGVGTVGEFRKVKDIPLLVRAYATVPAALRRRLLLAGFFNDDEEEAWTRTLLGELGVADQVELTGVFPHATVGDHLARMRVYVQSSGAEGLPNALLEAASLGVPLVATAVGGMREVLVDGRSALVVPHGDPDAMARAIARVLEDDELATALSAGARDLAATLSPERERREWLDLYARLLGPAAPARTQAVPRG